MNAAAASACARVRHTTGPIPYPAARASLPSARPAFPAPMIASSFTARPKKKDLRQSRQD
jgi:hypothetical protein